MEEKTTYLSWCDHAMIPTLSPYTVLDYFCKPTNPFYDKTCNNEHLRMQGFGLKSEQLTSMEGVEYILLLVQLPDLYVIRKQHRISPNETNPLVDYYIIKGVVYQSPDFGNILNSRLLNAVHSIRRALDEANTGAKFSLTKTPHSSTGDTQHQSDAKTQKNPNPLTKQRQNDPDRAPTAFQKMHVDPAIADLVRRYPPPQQILPSQNNNASSEKGAIVVQENLTQNSGSVNSVKRSKP